MEKPVSEESRKIAETVVGKINQEDISRVALALDARFREGVNVGKEEAAKIAEDWESSIWSENKIDVKEAEIMCNSVAKNIAQELRQSIGKGK